jgi:hypothetical protein
MTSGVTKKAVIFGKVFDLKKERRAIHYSEEKEVFARTEEAARAKIRTKLKNKWSGFIIVGGEVVK